MLALEMAVAPLSWLLPPVEPGPDLFARIAKAAGIGREAEGFHICRAGDTAWQTVAAGVRVRTLADGRPGGRRTILMEMSPGSVMPEHGHATDEECYVVEGEFEMGGATYRTGDFLVAPKGSAHPVVTSPRGCLVLLSMGAGT